MNTTRILYSARQIEERETALKWLREYGVQLDGKSFDQATIKVHLNFAGSCAGAKEAATVLESYAKLSLPDLVQTAITCCVNDIAIHRDAIRKELAQP